MTKCITSQFQTLAYSIVIHAFFISYSEFRILYTIFRFYVLKVAPIEQSRNSSNKSFWSFAEMKDFPGRETRKERNIPWIIRKFVFVPGGGTISSRHEFLTSPKYQIVTGIPGNIVIIEQRHTWFPADGNIMDCFDYLTFRRSFRTCRYLEISRPL